MNVLDQPHIFTSCSLQIEGNKLKKLQITDEDVKTEYVCTL